MSKLKQYNDQLARVETKLDAVCDRLRDLEVMTAGLRVHSRLITAAAGVVASAGIAIVVALIQGCLGG